MRGNPTNPIQPPNEETDDLAYHRQVFARRRKNLYLFLLLGCVGSLLLLVSLSLAQLAGITVDHNLDRLRLIVPVGLAAGLASFALARRGAVTAAAFAFLMVAVLMSTFLDDPLHVVEGRSQLAYLVVIIASGLLLPPYAAFVFAGIASLCVLLLSLQIGQDFAQPFIDMLDFFVVAIITWYFADRLERANQKLSRSRQELRVLNDELERRVDARTAELRHANTELARSSRLKDEFLAMMSHELRTPLTGIMMMSEVLSDQVYGPLTPKQQRNIDGIRTNASRLFKLINDVLDFSLLMAGGLAVSPLPISAAEVCRSVLQEMAPRAAARRVSLAGGCTAGPGAAGTADVTLHADKQRLHQVLDALLDNAIKFTPEGGSVGLDVIPAAAGRLHFVVWDTGIGISAEHVDELFKPFYQVDRRLSRNYEGAGLSLALAHRLVTLQGGTVEVASTPGQGSRFTVTLPCTVPEAAPTP